MAILAVFGGAGTPLEPLKIGLNHAKWAGGFLKFSFPSVKKGVICKLKVTKEPIKG